MNVISVKQFGSWPGPEVIKLFFMLNSASHEIYHANKCLNANNLINTTSERLKARNFFIGRYFSFYEQLKFRTPLSWAWKKYNLEARPQLLAKIINSAHWLVKG